MDNWFDILTRSAVIVIAGHAAPDGDCIGASFAAAFALKKLGKEVFVLLEEIPKRFRIIPGEEFLYKGDINGLNPDVFIALDCADKRRLGVFAPVFDRARMTFCADHHISNEGFADYNHIEPLASSTCEVIYKLAEGRVTLDANMASALYAGIVDDTGGFCHSCTSPAVHEIAAKLLAFDIAFNEIYNEMRNIRSVREAMALKAAIENMTVLEDGGIAYSYASRAQMDTAGIEYTDFEGVAEYLVNIRGVALSFFAYEKPGGCKVSLRSKEKDVSVIAAKLGGGGHHNAAGATVSATADKTVEIVLKELYGRYNI